MTYRIQILALRWFDGIDPRSSCGQNRLLQEDRKTALILLHLLTG